MFVEVTGGGFPIFSEDELVESFELAGGFDAHEACAVGVLRGEDFDDEGFDEGVEVDESAFWVHIEDSGIVIVFDGRDSGFWGLSYARAISGNRFGSLSAYFASR